MFYSAEVFDTKLQACYFRDIMLANAQQDMEVNLAKMQLNKKIALTKSNEDKSVVLKKQNDELGYLFVPTQVRFRD